jgi:chemotaxis protein MotA
VRSKNTLIGVVVAFSCLILALLLDHDSLVRFANPTALILVVGGTVSLAVAVSLGKNVPGLPKLVKTALLGQPVDTGAVRDRVVALATTARRDGTLALERELKDDDDPFFRRALEMVIDGRDAETVRDVMGAEILAMRRRHASGSSVLKKAGGFAPTLGIIGTVVGLIHVMSNLSSPSTLGPAIAVAFTATFWGVMTANLFWLPLGDKLIRLSEEEAQYREALLDGILAIQAGETPRIIESRLLSYVAAAERTNDTRSAVEVQPPDAGGEAA